MNRVEALLPYFKGNPRYNMRLLLSKITPSVIVPEVDKYYVFIYRAKTPNIRYDAHPFIQCTGIYKWGFTGYNAHWEDYRRYSWQEVVSNLYEINPSEVQTMANVPIARFTSS
jgi:hypothetical protein